ncbi:MAG: NAD(P)-binding protein, partial [bacterium]
MKKFDFDAVVIGSGFGGSVMTCRLAEKGYAVCLLERGRRYGYGEFPRHTHEAKNLFWDPDDDLHGLYEFNFFPKSDAYIVCGSGLGGGSLVYANVLMRMHEDFFQTWRGGI